MVPTSFGFHIQTLVIVNDSLLEYTGSEIFDLRFLDIIFSSTHVRKPRVFEYPKRDGCRNFQVYLKNIVSQRRDD